MTSPTFANVNYRPAGAQNAKQKMNIYVPPGTPPTGAWPVFISIDYGGFDTSDIPATLEDAKEVAIAAYHAGFAVVCPGLTIPNTVGVAEQGMFWLPTDPDWDIEGGQADIPHLDVVWIIQHLRANDSTYGIDMENWFIEATSAGSECAGFVVVSDDFADLGSGIAQCQESTQDGLRGFLSSLTQGHLTVFPTTQPPAVATVKHLRKNGATTLPAIQAVDTIAGHLTGSAYGYLMVQSAVIEKNGVIPFYMRAGAKVPGFAALGSVDYTINPTTLLPTLAGSPTQGIQDVHDSYQYVILVQQREAMSSLTEATDRLVSSVNWTVAGVSPDAIFASLEEVADDAVAWMLNILASGPTAGTLNLRMDWANPMELRQRGVQTSRDGGMVQRRQTQTTVSRNYEKASIRRWDLSWKSATRSEHDALVALYTAAGGGARPITFLPPNESSIIGRFLNGSLRTRQMAPGSFAMSCSVEEMP